MLSSGRGGGVTVNVFSNIPVFGPVLSSASGTRGQGGWSSGLDPGALDILLSHAAKALLLYAGRHNTTVGLKHTKVYHSLIYLWNHYIVKSNT